MPPEIRFGAIGLNHGHINNQVNLLLRAGAKLVSFFGKEPELAAKFAATYPQARQVQDPAEILEDNSLQMCLAKALILRMIWVWWYATRTTLP